MSDLDAIIIGAGHNGLTCAAYLGMAGLRVRVLERRGVVGGACVTEEVFPGYKVSTAAYVNSLFRKQIVRDLKLASYGFVVLERNTAVLEIKPGTYVPNEFAGWAPEEGDATATRFVKWITNAAPGERWSLTQRAVRASRVVRDEVE